MRIASGLCRALPLCDGLRAANICVCTRSVRIHTHGTQVRTRSRIGGRAGGDRAINCLIRLFSHSKGLMGSFHNRRGGVGPKRGMMLSTRDRMRNLRF